MKTDLNVLVWYLHAIDQDCARDSSTYYSHLIGIGCIIS